MHAPSIQQEIEALQRHLALLNDQAEELIRLRVKEARQVVAELELHPSEITGRQTASQIKAQKSFAPLSDEDLEVQILFVAQKAGDEGINGAEIARGLNQDPQRIRLWIKADPGKLRKEGDGRGTRYFAA